VPFDPGAGAPIVRSNDVDHVISNLVLSADYLFFVSGSRLYRVPKYGGAIEPVTSEAAAAPYALGANAREVFWMQGAGAIDDTHLALMRREAVGGPASTMRTDVSGVLHLMNINEVTVDDRHVLVNGPSGLEATSLASGATVRIPADYVPGVGYAFGASSYLLDGDWLYMMGCALDGFCGLARSDVGTGAFEIATAVAGVTERDDLRQLAGADETYLYWYEGPRISRFRKTDYASDVVYTSPEHVSARAPLVDDRAFYFVTDESPPITSTERTDAAPPSRKVQLVALAKDGSSVRVISTHPALWTTAKLAQDDQFLYVLVGGVDGTLDHGNEILIVAKDHTEG
jgi:hypothetical protein